MRRHRIAGSIGTDMATGIQYGPERPFEAHDYEMFHTPQFLSRYSKKILMDMVRVAKGYTGRKVHLFFQDKGSRCPQCINEITGEKMLSDCPMCHGTGRVHGWEYQGYYYTQVDFQPRQVIATENGTVNNQGGNRDSIYVLGAPLIHDQDLILFEETKELYKVYDVEPQLVALRGDVIIQIAQGSLVEYGSPEYKCLEVLPSCFSLSETR